jgi:hypothetical protein
MFRVTFGENTLDRRCAPLTLMFAVLMALGWSSPTAAQPIERPTDCTEETAVSTIFIGHDCGEWASVIISGNIIIRKPWSLANRASRAVRLRERREGSPVTAPPTSVPDLAIAPGQTRIYETGAGADPASGGINRAIYDDDRLSEEGARVLAGTGESIEAPCAT